MKTNAITHAQRRAIKKRNWLIVKSLISIIIFALITRSLALSETNIAEILFSYSLWAFVTLMIFIGDM